jgi:hypothetical protein
MRARSFWVLSFEFWVLGFAFWVPSRETQKLKTQTLKRKPQNYLKLSLC